MKLSLSPTAFAPTHGRFAELIEAVNGEISVLGEKFVDRFSDVAEALNENERLRSMKEKLRESAERATKEIDAGLGKVGLMRTDAHEAEIARMKKKQQSLRKAAVTRALKKAAANNETH